MKNNKNKIFRFIFLVFFMSFFVIYFAELTGYYEYKNYRKTTLTEEQIKKFEQDIINGKEIDLNAYVVSENKSYGNKLSILASNLSYSISNIVKNGIDKMFKALSSLVEE